MGFDASLLLVKDWAQRQIPFEVLEGFLHVRQLRVKFPPPRRIALGQIRPQ